MDGITVLGILAVVVGPLYPIVIHNAIESRMNRKLLERMNGIVRDESDPKEGSNDGS